jgi:acyl-CoA thioesterase II
MSVLPPVLQAEKVGDGRFTAPQPDEDPEGRDVVFSGQLLAQMIMTSVAAGDVGAKVVKSVHGVFARAGFYSAGPVEYVVEPMHAGRAWASDSIAVHQGDRLLARGLVLLNTLEPDLIRHAPATPAVAAPEECATLPVNVVFPGSEVRDASPSSGPTGGPPSVRLWIRMPASYDLPTANQAMVAWSQPGFLIGAAMDAHPDAVDPTSPHRSVSTGVIAHTAHFHDQAPVDDWLLFTHEAAYAGHGRVFGTGAVFTRDGVLLSTFDQDSMVRGVERELDWRRDM